MGVIAVRQSTSGSNEFFLLDSYEEHSLLGILDLVAAGSINGLDIVLSKQGKAYVRTKKNSQTQDNLEHNAITCNALDYLYSMANRSP